MNKSLCQKEWEIILDSLNRESKILEHYWGSTEESVTFQDDCGNIATWKYYTDGTISLYPGREIK